MGSVTLESQVRPSSEALSRSVGGEAVVLNLETQSYHGLDPVGSRVWELLQQQPCRLDTVLEVLLSEYDVPRERAETDLLALVRALLERRLVTLH